MSIRRLVGLASLARRLLRSSPCTRSRRRRSPRPRPPQLMLISFTHVRPGMGPKYIDLQVKEVMPAQKKGGSPGRQAFSSGVTGAPGEFVFLTPITSMAMFDEPPPMQKALGPEGGSRTQPEAGGDLRTGRLHHRPHAA